MSQELAGRLALPSVEWFAEVGSTLDVAHELAGRGAPAGTLILADAQTAGRGRMGRSWRSDPNAGVWLTLIERPETASGLDVLSLRAGLEMAPALDPLAPNAVRLKWPNDLYIAARKLGGILIEARWREGSPEWVAIGVGINLVPPVAETGAVGLNPGVTRDEVLAAVVPALREAARQRGPLTDLELEAFAQRDLGAGRSCREPVPGRVRGIDPTGSLLVDVTSSPGKPVAVRAGSLVFSEEE